MRRFYEATPIGWASSVTGLPQRQSLRRRHRTTLLAVERPGYRVHATPPLPHLNERADHRAHLVMTERAGQNSEVQPVRPVTPDVELVQGSHT